MRVLFLEDNELFIEAMLLVFRRAKWTPVHLNTVSAAKNIFDENNFDVVITDLHLAEDGGGSNSGLDFLHYVRERKQSRIPVIVTTGLDLTSEEDILQQGADLFFFKPNIKATPFIQQIKTLVETKKRA